MLVGGHQLYSCPQSWVALKMRSTQGERLPFSRMITPYGYYMLSICRQETYQQAIAYTPPLRSLHR